MLKNLGSISTSLLNRSLIATNNSHATNNQFNIQGLAGTTGAQDKKGAGLDGVGGFACPNCFVGREREKEKKKGCFVVQNIRPRASMSSFPHQQIITFQQSSNLALLAYSSPLECHRAALRHNVSRRGAEGGLIS